jgi:hypothetical protein
MSDWGSLNVHLVPPPPSEIISASLSWGFLETDGTRNFTYWDLPVTTSTLSLAGATAYTREVPEPSTLLLLNMGLAGLCLSRKRLS